MLALFQVEEGVTWTKEAVASRGAEGTPPENIGYQNGLYQPAVMEGSYVTEMGCTKSDSLASWEELTRYLTYTKVGALPRSWAISYQNIKQPFNKESKTMDRTE